ncbi:MAG: DUF2279 domain-containing protein [Candidatus Zixiibacteriota bacterium]
MLLLRCLVIASLLCSGYNVARSESLAPDSTTHTKSHVDRNMLIGNIVVGTGAYFYFKNTWGAPDGKFHFKDELHDNVAFTDEISHFYAGYKLADGFRWLFRMLKMPESKQVKYGAIQSAIILTLVEVPMDAFNPDQGFGVSDIVLDYGGIGFALLKDKYPNNFDMKFSLHRPPWKFDNKFLAGKNEEFANFIWWATYTPKVVSIGLGYGIKYVDGDDVQSEYFVGVGATLYDLLLLVKPKWAAELKALDCYFINFKFAM